VTILLTGDLHWNDQQRDSYRHAFVKDLVSIISEEQVDYLYILGDLTEEKDRHGAWLVGKVFEHVSRLAELCVVVILRGNHDYITPSAPFFRVLSRIQDVHWANVPSVADQHLFLPHTTDYKRDWNGLLDKRYTAVFTHNTFEGAVSESGQELGGIPISVFKRDQPVFSGDVHVPQKVGPVEYVGAPYPINFGDSYEGRVVLLKNGKVRSIRYEGPSKLVADVDLGGELDMDGLREGDILKIRVHLNQGQGFGQFQIYKEHLLGLLKNTGCIVHMIQPVMEKQSYGEQAKRQPSRKNDAQVLRSYASSVKAAEKVVRTGLRLMRRV
jgi:hypothetical protein